MAELDAHKIWRKERTVSSFPTPRQLAKASPRVHVGSPWGADATVEPPWEALSDRYRRAKIFQAVSEYGCVYGSKW